MKIYIGHAKCFDFKNELYKPITESILNEEHTIILPHEESEKPSNSKDFLKTCDLMIAEVSYRATGLGIELGWADMLGVTILCIFRQGVKISSSVKFLTDNFIEYSDSHDLVEKIKEFIQRGIV